VEDGVAFCLHCGAPQIRISGLRPQQENSLPAGERTDQLTSPLPDAFGELPPVAESLRFRQPSGVRWPEAARSAFLAGCLLTLAMAVPYAAPLAWFFVATIAAGGLAAALYARRSRLALTPARGARLGMLGGLAGWVTWVTICVLVLSLGGGQLIAGLRQAMQQKLAASSSPQAQVILSSPGGMATILVLSSLMVLVIVLICSAIGGAVGAKLFGKDAEGKR